MKFWTVWWISKHFVILDWNFRAFWISFDIFWCWNSSIGEIKITVKTCPFSETSRCRHETETLDLRPILWKIVFRDRDMSWDITALVTIAFQTCDPPSNEGMQCSYVNLRWLLVKPIPSSNFSQCIFYCTKGILIWRYYIPSWLSTRVAKSELLGVKELGCL